MKLPKLYGRVIKALREFKKKDQLTVAKSLGIKVADLIEIEAGKAQLEVEKSEGAVDAIAEALGATPTEFAEALAKAAEPDESAADEEPDDDVTEEEDDDEPAKSEGGGEKKVSKKEPTAAEIKKAKRENAFGSFGVKKVKVDDNGDGSEPVAKSKEARMHDVFKMLLGDNADQKVRKGTMVAGDFSPSSTIAPEQQHSLISLLIDQTPFLKDIQVRTLKSLKGDINVWDIGARKGKRFLQGFWPTADTNMATNANKSLQVNLGRVDIDFLLTDDLLRAYADNLPGLEQEVVPGFLLQAGNEIVDLGFNGLADSAAIPETTWTNLGKGWIKRAQETTPAGQIGDISDLGVAADTHIERLNKLIDLGMSSTNKRFFNSATDFVLGTEDWDDYEAELLTRSDSTPILVAGAQLKYRGRPVTPINFIDTGNYIHTSKKNFVLAIAAGGADGINMKAYEVPGGRLVRVTFWVDYEFVNYDAITLLKP